MEYPRMCPARWLSDQNFPMCVPPHDFLCPFQDIPSNYYRHWKWCNQSTCREFNSTIENEKGNCKITLDVLYFRPNEINVRVTDYEIIVEARHEERADTHGFVTRQFKRRYPLPNHCPSENVTSTLSSDGVLTIIAEKISPINKKEKIVPIKICGTSRKTLVETKIPSEITQKNVKDTEDIFNKKINQKTFKEDHSCLLQQEKSKAISENIDTCTKEVIKECTDIMETFDKIDPLSISSTSNKIEESIEKTILGLTALTEQLGRNRPVSTSEMCSMNTELEVSGIKSETGETETKIASDMSCTKSGTEMSSMKSATEMCTIKSATDINGAKSATEISGTKSVTEMSGTKCASETSTIKSAQIADPQSALQMIGMTSACQKSSGIKSTLEIPETSGIKSASEIFGIKSLSEVSGKITSDVCDRGALAKAFKEESFTSFKSSSSMLSTTSVSGNTADCVFSDIKTELREAAENV